VSGDALHRQSTGFGRTWSLAFALAGLLAAALPHVAHAQAGAAAPDSSAAPPDTGWIEVGGTAAFGASDPFADLPSAEDEGPVRPEGGRLFPYLTYNRVDSYTLGIDETFNPSRGWMPSFSTRMARAFGRENGPGKDDGRWVYAMRLDQPIASKRRGHVGISVYRRTDDDEFGQVGDVENALAALFFHWDYKDWFEREGYALDAEYKWKDHWIVSGRYDQDTYRSITEIGDATMGIFRRTAEWRANPAVDDGNLRSATFGLGFDSRSNPKAPRRGMYHKVLVETAGGDLGGDFGYKRYTADLRAYFAPGPSHTAKVRAMLGTTSEGDALPFQKTFAVGGIGTLRAYPFRQYRGRHMFLTNGDWTWELFKRSSRNAMLKTGFAAVAFTDFGLAWDAPTWDLGQRRPAWDAGLGVGTTDETLRVYFAKDLRSGSSPIQVTLRIARSY
jgi:surface antigen Omp85-like protein